MRKIAVSVDEPRIARRRGASLAKLLLGYWRTFVGRASGADAAAALFALMDEHPGDTCGRRTGRGEAYEGRV